MNPNPEISANYAKIRELAKNPVYKADVKVSTQYQKMTPDCDRPVITCAGGNCEDS